MFSQPEQKIMTTTYIRNCSVMKKKLVHGGHVKECISPLILFDNQSVNQRVN